MAYLMQKKWNEQKEKTNLNNIKPLFFKPLKWGFLGIKIKGKL